MSALERLAGKQSAVCWSCKRDVAIYLPRLESRGDSWLYKKHRVSKEKGAPYCPGGNDVVDTDTQESSR